MARNDILLVGDGTELLNTIGWVLQYRGFAIKVTASPEAALEALVKKNYDLVIAKLTTNDLESLDILTRARRLNPEVKIMVVSGNNDAIFPLEAYQVDVDDYLLMPVSPPELWRRGSDCLKDQEVVDLQPVAVTANSGMSSSSESHMMLMLHDIRGSMVSTAALLKLMSRGMYGDMDEAAKARLQEAAGRIEQTVRLTEDFFDWSVSGRRPKREHGDLLDLSADIVDPVLAELAPEIRDRQITLVNRLHDHGNGKIPVKGSKLLLQSVFRNLVNNGIKYGDRRCSIVVEVETQGPTRHLHVYNTGRPIPEARRSMLFSCTPSAKRVQKGREGLGLGLCLSRDLLQNYGGDIWYEAKSGGSNFVMSLP
jgi:two-component system, sensor histidine kinase and response regulator